MKTRIASKRRFARLSPFACICYMQRVRLSCLVVHQPQALDELHQETQMQRNRGDCV